MAQRISRRKAAKMDYRALKKILHSLYNNKRQTPLSFDEAEECGIEVMRMSWDEEHLFFTPLQSPAVEQLLRDLDEMPQGEGPPYPSIEGGVSDTRKLSEYFDDHFADVIEDTRWSCIGDSQIFWRKYYGWAGNNDKSTYETNSLYQVDGFPLPHRVWNMFHYADNTEDDTIFYGELRSAVAHAMDGIKADAEHRFKTTPILILSFCQRSVRMVQAHFDRVTSKLVVHMTPWAPLPAPGESHIKEFVKLYRWMMCTPTGDVFFSKADLVKPNTTEDSCKAQSSIVGIGVAKEGEMASLKTAMVSAENVCEEMACEEIACEELVSEKVVCEEVITGEKTSEETVS